MEQHIRANSSRRWRQCKKKYVADGARNGGGERRRQIVCCATALTLGATSIGTSDLYRIIGSYANQSADIADPVEPIERSSSLSGNLVTERFI